MAKIILEQDIKDLLLELSQSQAIFAPVEQHRQAAFSQVNFKLFATGDVLSLAYPVTIIPPKEFLLPPQEELFKFSGQKIMEASIAPAIIFGLSFEDLEGVAKLKKIFKERIADVPATKRAEKLVLVAVDNFSPPAGLDFDLYLMRFKPKQYLAFPKSKSGQRILKSKYFREVSMKVPKVTKKIDPLLTHPKLAQIVKQSKDHPVWDELAEKCWGCGICSYVCPLCYCFDTSDKVLLNNKEKTEGSRCRQWDSCMLKGFAATASHNFRPELKDRIYHWYFHKFVRMPKENGFVGCVDCNRCVVYCPAKINFRMVLGRLIADSEKRGAK